MPDLFGNSDAPRGRDHLSTVRGQDIAIQTLRRALGGNRIHHAYLFDGADGVGKERAAVGLAQALLCERRQPDGGDDSACGVCSACERTVRQNDEGKLTPVHPDFVILERGRYEPGMIGRRTPETQDLSIDQVRTLVLARAAFAPHEGRAKVFLIRRAEELSISAANALLKTLEEPNARTHFILTSAQPDSLLSTIRSRTQRIRFGLLAPAVIAELLTTRGIDAARAKTVSELSDGTMRAALDLASEEEDATVAFVTRAREAIDRGDMSIALAIAEDGKKYKGDLNAQLEALSASFALEARHAAADRGRAAELAAIRYRLTIDALRQLEGNGSAQLVLEALFSKMRAA